MRSKLLVVLVRRFQATQDRIEEGENKRQNSAILWTSDFPGGILDPAFFKRSAFGFEALSGR